MNSILTQSLISSKSIIPTERLIMALDMPDASVARVLVSTLGDSVNFYKIGLGLFMGGGYFEFLDWLIAQDKKVFVDLKFFDVPETVRIAVQALASRGATFTTVHGNQRMMEAAVSVKGDHLKILAVTVLTSLDRGDLDDLGFDCDVDVLVLSRARRALEAGCDGIISSGLEVPLIRRELGNRILVMTPSIRPLENKLLDDQKRVVNAAQAFTNGADYIIVGRPISQVADPRAAALAVQATIAECFSSS